MKKIITNNEKETRDLAKNLAKTLNGGEIIGLNGELGAGKTIFTKGIAEGLDIKNNVNSPTFVLMKVYDAENKNIKKLVHIDAYRIKHPKDLEAIGALDYINRKDTVTIIEWIENIKEIISKETIDIELKHLGENKREVIIHG